MNGAPAKSLLDGAVAFAIDPATIDVSDRIGFLHSDKAAAIGKLMFRDGQRDAIKVSRTKAGSALAWKLHVGLHRTIGAKNEGIQVYAIEVSGKPEDLVDLEASENLHRRPLGPIERAKFTAALVQAAQERIAREHGGLSQHKLAVKARWDKVKHGESRVSDALTEEVEDTCAKFAHVYGWEESVGEALGMSRRTIHNDLTLFRLLIEPFPDLIEQLAQHPVIGENASQLKLIAQVQDEKLRRRVIELLLADGHMTVEAARVEVGVDRGDTVAPTPELKFVNAVVGNLSRLTATQQKRNIDAIVGALGSVEVKRQLRDRLNQELGE